MSVIFVKKIATTENWAGNPISGTNRLEILVKYRNFVRSEICIKNLLKLKISEKVRHFRQKYI
mgnify:CR=1 FL=1